MIPILLVSIGGGIGAITRFKLGGYILHHTSDWKFPLSTFCVNVVGCLIAGLLSGVVEKHDALSADARLFLFTGILGGFTTFSAFGVETITLFQRHEPLVAILNVILSVTAGLTALWFGIKIV